MSKPRSTGRRVASRAAARAAITKTHASASAAYLPRAVRRGRKRLIESANASAQQGSVLEFNTTSGQLNINYDASAVTTDQATFEVWIKTTVKGQQMIFNGANVAPFIIVENDQLLVYWNDAVPSTGWLSVDTTPITDGQWHHIATIDSVTGALFWTDVATGQNVKSFLNLTSPGSYMTDPVIQNGCA
jgi:hypothetical protein